MRRPVSTGIEGMIGGVGKVIQIGKKTAKIDAFDDLSFDIWQGTNKLMSGVKAMSINLTCPDGHKVKVTLSNG